jgi:hypothetical protein
MVTTTCAGRMPRIPPAGGPAGTPGLGHTRAQAKAQTQGPTSGRKHTARAGVMHWEFFYNVYSHKKKKEKKTRCRYESPTEETREEHG